MQSSYSIAFHVFSDSTDTSHGAYPMMAFMTVFKVHTEAIVQEQLLQRPRLIPYRGLFSKKKISNN